MMLACTLCGQMVEQLPTAAPGVPIVGDPNRGAAEFQASVHAFAQHVAKAHPQYMMLLAATAQTYHLQLIAKLATSGDPDFNEERENARALCYWTLAGELEFSSPPPKIANGR